LPPFAVALGGSVPEGQKISDAGLFLTVGLTLLKVSSFVAIVMIFGPRFLPWLLRQVARTGSRELFTLSVLTTAIGIAFGSAKLFGVSFALGAFFAGLVLSESNLSHKAAANVLPLQDAFAVLFFLSVGMLFDPSIILKQPFMLGGVLLLILVGKSLAALGIVLAMGYPVSTALTVAASLAQIGEFSFILAGLGAAYGLLPHDAVSLILAGAILSIMLNPLAFATIDRMVNWINVRPNWRRRCEELRAGPLNRLQADLEAVRQKLEKKAAAHKTFTAEELVERFPLFASLSPEQRETLILHFRTRNVQPGERIIRVGDKPDAVYFISSGEVEVTVARRKIKLSAGNFFGEMALMSKQPRTADVTALDYGSLLMLSQRDFLELLRRNPDIRMKMVLLAEERKEMNRHLADDQSPDGLPV
jgi:monovalent cation:H+ antiporter-2, CPA2 family